MDHISDDDLRDILKTTRIIAMPGASPNPARPSHGVARYLLGLGYQVIPVNPGQAGAEILGQPVYANLAAIPEGAGVDLVDIFRQSSAVPDIVDQALASLPDLKVIWMQLGVVNEAAAEKARAQGIKVVQNRCPKIEYARLFGAAPLATLVA